MTTRAVKIECPNLAGIKFSVKRDWEGQVNYYPANEEHFIIYYPESLEEKNKLIWKQMVNKRKQAISERLSKIFGSTNNVKKVRYCNRLRLSFPCPEVVCSFQTVDLKKHLLSKHKWDQLEAKLQLNYFNVMADYNTRLNTYKINQPAICFKCSLIELITILHENL